MAVHKTLRTSVLFLCVQSHGFLKLTIIFSLIILFFAYLLT